MNPMHKEEKPCWLNKFLYLYKISRAVLLPEITRLMAENGIDIRAISISDTVDFGILRLIVNDPEKCEKVLKETGLPFPSQT